MEIAISRLPAAKESERIGALVWASGVPGLSGLYVPAPLLPAQLSDRFDLIGFDARGTGMSEALEECGNTPDVLQSLKKEKDLEKIKDLNGLAEAARTYTDGCTKKLGSIAGHLGSRDVARDVDAIRAALGEEKVSLLMGSYHTMLAQAYLSAYPDRVRAAVLDGTLDPTVSGAQATIEYSGAMEEAQSTGNEDEANRETLRTLLSGFTPWCRAHENACPLHADPLSDAEKAAGLKGRSGNKAARTKAVLQAASAAALLPDLWPDLATALRAARDDADLAALNKLAAGGLPKELMAFQEDQDLGYTLGVLCADFAWPRSVEGILDDYTKTGDSDAGRRASAYLPCADWPRPEKPLGALSGSPDITPLVINGERDSITRIKGARATAKRLKAELVTFPGSSHVATASGVECAQRAAAAYLTSGKAENLPTC
ncbi:alpha/beta fold hydrolase [Streptomyces sp. NPDC093982]|uniref:alpha/beta fold hydrolase n=1 Tax=Streptomyces sp. NPDC093982 TaxID=3155077 RepID=UPI003414D1DE